MAQSAHQPRVLHVNDQRGWRGGEQQMLYLAEGLKRRSVPTAAVLQRGCPAARRAAAAGIEVHEPGVGHCMLHAATAGISNLRLSRRDAIEVMTHQIPDASLNRVNLYFPDPWPKKRHHKRRILQSAFLALVAEKIEAAGSFRISTSTVRLGVASTRKLWLTS